jgi:hypothetical protein
MEVKKPLPTTFRTTYSVSMAVELAELVRAMHNEHSLNVPRELEPLIKRWALKRARQINAKLGQKKQS